MQPWRQRIWRNRGRCFWWTCGFAIECVYDQGDIVRQSRVAWFYYKAHAQTHHPLTLDAGKLLISGTSIVSLSGECLPATLQWLAGLERKTHREANHILRLTDRRTVRSL